MRNSTNDNTQQKHIDETLEGLEDWIDTNLNTADGLFQPLLLLSGAGQGKTQFVTRELPKIISRNRPTTPDRIGIVIEKPARRDAAELAGAGMPSTDTDGSAVLDFSKPPTIRKVEHMLATGLYDYIILLWDESMAAGASEQKVICDSADPEEHSIGGFKLPANVFVMLTGNRAKDKAGSNRALAQLTNRVMVVNVIFDINAWSRWAYAHNINPVAIECAVAHTDPNTGEGFFVQDTPAEDVAYCTPRSYVRAAMHLDAYMRSDKFDGTIPARMERMFAANIGSVAARLLTGWVAKRDHVPTAAEILRSPDTAKVSDQTGFQMIAANIAMAAVTDSRSATAVLHYIVRLRTDLQVSLGTKLMGMATRKGWLMTDPLAAAFIAKFHQLIPLALMDSRSN